MSWKQQGQLERTTLRRVRANSPARRRNAERRCTCGEAVRLPEPRSGRKRLREACLRWSVSKSFQGMRIEEKGHNAHEGDAMVVKPRLLVGVSGDYDFAEVVFDVAKGKCFLFPFRMVWDGKCRLDVNAFGCLVHNEIDFITPDFMLAGRSCSVYRYIAHVNRISSHCKLVEDCVFHKVRPFVLSEVETGVAEPAICGIVFERGSDVSTAFNIITHFLELYEFRHAKRLYMYDLASPAKFRGDVGRKHFGVGSGDIYIDVGDLPQCVQNMIEGHIRIFPRFWVQFCEIDPFAQHLVASLNFVDDDEDGFAVIGKHCLDVSLQFDWIKERVIFGLLEINFQDMVSGDTLINEMLFEDAPEKVTFPASSNAGYDFHCAIHLCINELPQIFWSFNRHGFAVFGFMGKPIFCKVAILYHNDCDNVKRWLFKSCEDTSFVKGGCSGCFRPKIRSAA